MQTSNWAQRATGKRCYGKGEVYAFEDAMRWAPAFIGRGFFVGRPKKVEVATKEYRENLVPAIEIPTTGSV